MLQVHELQQLAIDPSTTVSVLCGRLKAMAEKFVEPGCANEVNVKGESRTAALEAISVAVAATDRQAAAKHNTSRSSHGWRGRDRMGGGVVHVTAELATLAATRALGDLSREVIMVVIHDIWARFRISPEFKRLMESKVCATDCVFHCYFLSLRLISRLLKGLKML